MQTEDSISICGPYVLGARGGNPPRGTYIFGCPLHISKGKGLYIRHFI